MVLFSEVDEITVAKKSGFDWCTNKKLRKILAKICFWIKTTGNWRFPGLPNLAFYCDQIPSCSNPVNPNYHLLSSNYHNYVLFLSNC